MAETAASVSMFVYMEVVSAVNKRLPGGSVSVFRSLRRSKELSM